MMRFLTILLLMIIGVGHGWANSDVGLAYADFGPGAGIVGMDNAALGAPGLQNHIEGVTGADFPSFFVAGGGFVSHQMWGKGLCASEIAGIKSESTINCPQSSKIFSDEKPTLLNFESNSFIFRPPIR